MDIEILYFHEWWRSLVSWGSVAYQEPSGEGQQEQISKANKWPVFIQTQDEKSVLKGL